MPTPVREIPAPKAKGRPFRPKIGMRVQVQSGRLKGTEGRVGGLNRVAREAWMNVGSRKLWFAYNELKGI